VSYPTKNSEIFLTIKARRVRAINLEYFFAFLYHDKILKKHIKILASICMTKMR